METSVNEQSHYSRSGETTTETICSSVETNVENKYNFPTEVFHPVIKEIVEQTNRFLGFPTDFISCAILWAASVAIGNTVKLFVKQGWLEPANLFMAFVAPPGTNKTHPISFAIKPIIQSDLHFETLLRSKYSGEKLSEQILSNKKILTDATQEALIQALSYNSRGIGLHSDELSSWISNFNRYNRGSDEPFWLSAWNVTSISKIRVTSVPVSIANPFISVIGSVQPNILKELATKNRQGNGFIDRILFSYPNNLKKEYFSEESINPSIESNWKIVIDNLFNLNFHQDELGNNIPNVITKSPEANRLFVDWQRQNTDLVNSNQQIDINGAIIKMENQIFRLAIILECLNYACIGPGAVLKSISSNSMLGAIKLVKYFTNCAQRVGNLLNQPIEKLTKQQREIYSELPETFTTGHGIKIAANHEMIEKTFMNFLKNVSIFYKIRHGEHGKVKL